MSRRASVPVWPLLALLAGAAGVARAQTAPAAEVAGDAAAAFLAAAAERLADDGEVARLREVVAFARRAHAGLTRDGGEPALLHSLRVADGILNRDGPLAYRTVAAAVLHDVVEATPVAGSEVEGRFGRDVAAIVAEVSRARGAGDRAARSRAFFARLRAASREAHLIAYYERLDGIRDMAGWSLEGKLGYLESTRAGLVPALADRSPDLARALRVEVERLASLYRAERDAAGPAFVDGLRRPDGTLDWGRFLAAAPRPPDGGRVHCSLAMFLRELAAVAASGERARVEELFDGLLETDFFSHYGRFAESGRLTHRAAVARVLRTRFVDGLLETHAALTLGLALPELARGEWTGDAYALSFSALGLSSRAVAAGAAALSWVRRLTAAGRTVSRTARAVRSAKKWSRFGTLKGWVYTVAETVVVIYLADKAEAWVREELARREAHDGIEAAGLAFFRRVGDADLTPARLRKAVDLYAEAWTAYREWLYAPLYATRAEHEGRLDRLAARARRLDGQQRALGAALRGPGLPALRRRLFARGDYLSDRLAEARAGLAAEADAIVAAYDQELHEELAGVYGEDRRGTPYLADAPDRRWHATGSVDGAPGDPGAGRALADLRRARSRSAFRSALGDASEHRLETYADEAAALALAAEALSGRPGLRAVLARARERVARQAELERGLVAAVTHGLADALAGAGR